MNNLPHLSGKQLSATNDTSTASLLVVENPLSTGDDRELKYLDGSLINLGEDPGAQLTVENKNYYNITAIVPEGDGEIALRDSENIQGILIDSVNDELSVKSDTKITSAVSSRKAEADLVSSIEQKCDIIGGSDGLSTVSIEASGSKIIGVKEAAPKVKIDLEALTSLQSGSQAHIALSAENPDNKKIELSVVSGGNSNVSVVSDDDTLALVSANLNLMKSARTLVRDNNNKTRFAIESDTLYLANSAGEKILSINDSLPVLKSGRVGMNVGVLTSDPRSGSELKDGALGDIVYGYPVRVETSSTGSHTATFRGQEAGGTLTCSPATTPSSGVSISYHLKVLCFNCNLSDLDSGNASFIWSNLTYGKWRALTNMWNFGPSGVISSRIGIWVRVE